MLADLRGSGGLLPGELLFLDSAPVPNSEVPTLRALETIALTLDRFTLRYGVDRKLIVCCDGEKAYYFVEAGAADDHFTRRISQVDSHLKLVDARKEWGRLHTGAQQYPQ